MEDIFDGLPTRGFGAEELKRGKGRRALILRWIRCGEEGFTFSWLELLEIVVEPWEAGWDWEYSVRFGVIRTCRGGGGG